jgi:hypothetical protein
MPKYSVIGKRTPQALPITPEMIQDLLIRKEH